MKNVVLQFPNYDHPFLIFADASSHAIGGYVAQKADDDGPPRPISFFSRVLSPTERNYSTLDREALSIYHVLSSARSWLLGFRIILCSDHRPLKFIYHNGSASSRLQRWRMLIQEYAPEINYIKGSSNVTADWLSRYAAHDMPTEHSVAMQESYVAASHDSALPQAIPENFSPDE